MIEDPYYDYHIINSEREKLDSLAPEGRVKMVDEPLVKEKIRMVLILGRK